MRQVLIVFHLSITEGKKMRRKRLPSGKSGVGVPNK
jgi:hypothetical protein